MSAPKFKLDNLIAILDYNHGQIDGPVDQVMPIEPIADKWRAFNWHVIEIDGHDMGQISRRGRRARRRWASPTFIVAHTVKGKGVCFMETRIGWHGGAPNKEETEKALAELLRPRMNA